MTITTNGVTKVFDDSGQLVATIKQHGNLNMWLLDAADLPRVIAFRTLEDAIYNAK